MNVVPQEDFITLLKSRGSATLRAHLPRYDVDMILGRGECVVHEGDLVQGADWRLPRDNLLVLGSVRCGGLVDLAPTDSDEWGGSLWVLGDLVCRDFCGHFGATLVVDGAVAVARLAVAAFEDSTLIVTGDFTAHFFYGEDIWVEVGGRASMEFGDGYTLPLGYSNAAKQAVKPRQTKKASLARLNLDDGEAGPELADKLRRGDPFRRE